MYTMHSHHLPLLLPSFHLCFSNYLNGTQWFWRLAVCVLFFWVGGGGRPFCIGVGVGGRICTIYNYNEKNSDDIWGARSIVPFGGEGGTEEGRDGGEGGKGRAEGRGGRGWLIRRCGLPFLCFLYTRPAGCWRGGSGCFV